MSDYTIYKLCNDECDEIYVGSTKAYAARKYCHKSDCCNPNGKHYNLNVYQIIRANGGWFAWHMIPIEVIHNTTKREAEIVEDVWRVKLDAKMNTNKASRGDITMKEYHKQYSIVNKKQINITSKQHNLKNKEKNSIKNLKKIKCKCGCLISYQNLARHQTTTKCMKLMKKQNDQANMKELPVIGNTTGC
jgi:hypothetical protein